MKPSTTSETLRSRGLAISAVGCAVQLIGFAVGASGPGEFNALDIFIGITVTICIASVCWTATTRTDHTGFTLGVGGCRSILGASRSR